MWSPDYDIIVETLTGSEFEVTVRETDTIGYLKYRIKKYEGIPVSQQHILFNQAELKDSTILKDVPLVKGSRLTLVLGMRGGPISARRVMADCDNWYDLSEVLNSASSSSSRSSQHAPIEPLSIATTGVKVLLYKDCKKNINRLMKLRRHHLHSQGTTSGGSGAGAGSNIGGSKANMCSSSAGRTHLKFLDKQLISEDQTKGVAEMHDQQWLMDNITTLKKMKQLRQSLEAKKKKKPRSSETQNFCDEISKDLCDVQMDLEMHEKLQRWLHRVASNSTHLSDPDALAQQSLATGSASAHSQNMFERVRRKSAGICAGTTKLGLDVGGVSGSRAESFSRRPFSRTGSLGNDGTVVGGARKKDSYPSITARPSGGGTATALISSSMYPVPVDEFALIARDYRKAAAALALNKLSEMVDDDDEHEDQFTKLSTEEIDRRLEAANSDINHHHPHFENRKKPSESSSQFEDRLLTQFYDSSSTQYENLFRASDTLKAEDGAKSKFCWRFHGENKSSPKCSTSADASESSDTFLNSLLLKRRNVEKQTVSRPDTLAGDYFLGRAEVESEWTGPGRDPEMEERSTVIIERADENSEEESLLEAVCTDILNDPDAFEGDEEHLKDVHELIDIMGLDSSEDSDSGSAFSVSKGCEYFELEDDLCPGDTQTGADIARLLGEEDVGPYIAPFSSRASEKSMWPEEELGVAANHRHSSTEPVAEALPRAVTEQEDECESQDNADNDQLEFDDLAYFPLQARFTQSSSKGPPTIRRPSASVGKGMFPEVSTHAGESSKRSLMAVNHLGGECLVGPSLPEIINRGTAKPDFSVRHQESSEFTAALKESAPKPTNNVSLPEMKLLESDLKMMGLDAILDDSDDHFERTIKRQLRSAESVAYGATVPRGSRGLLRDVADPDPEWLTQVGSEKMLESRGPPKPDPASRCAKCNKKLGIIMIMKCHCGLFFCAKHRYPEAHDCGYDFKEEGKRILSKENPLVVGEKLPKI